MAKTGTQLLQDIYTAITTYLINGRQRTQIVNSSGQSITSTSNALNVHIASGTGVSSLSTGTPTTFRSLLVDTDEVEVKATAGNLYGWNIINRIASTIYVKFYNSSSVTPASDVPILTLMVPASGSVFQEPNCIQINFSTALSVRAVTGITDTDTTDPGTLPIIELKYA